jgi:hypothetical protein
MFRAATVALWKRMAGWTRDQMMDAGGIVYFSIVKDFAHLAGVYEVDDWMKIDARADRFRSLLNDEFGRDFLGELVGGVSLPSQRLHDYAMMQHNGKPVRYISHVPYAVLTEGGGEGLGESAIGVSHLADKADRYVTTRGPLTLAELNARAAAFTPRQMDESYRFPARHQHPTSGRRARGRRALPARAGELSRSSARPGIRAPSRDQIEEPCAGRANE